MRDILHRLADRCPTRVVLWPVLVQGEGAALQVARAIRGFDAMTPDGSIPRPDLLIVARGGGSIEDLWAFNEEPVIRAVADCRRSEEHTSELQSLMRLSYAVFCLKKQTTLYNTGQIT